MLSYVEGRQSLLVGETFPGHPGMRDTHRPTALLQDLIEGPRVVSSVADDGLLAQVLLVQPGNNVRQLVVVLL